MAERIERTPVDGAVRFVLAGDSGAWADPTADGIFSELLRQVAELDPPPAFFANLGDFAGPGTPERHEHYLGLVAGLPIPDLCVVGNHDLDDPAGLETFERIHGPVTSSSPAAGLASSRSGRRPARSERWTSSRRSRAGDEDLAFLDEALREADEPKRVVLMHAPPHA